MTQNVSLNDFKTHCFKLAERVFRDNVELILTKYGKPIARVMPLASSRPPGLNALQGTGIMMDDLMKPVQAEWHCLDNDLD